MPLQSGRLFVMQNFIPSIRLDILMHLTMQISYIIPVYGWFYIANLMYAQIIVFVVVCVCQLKN